MRFEFPGETVLAVIVVFPYRSLVESKTVERRRSSMGEAAALNFIAAHLAETQSYAPIAPSIRGMSANGGRER